MKLAANTRVFLAWLAIASMLMVALAPPLARMFAADSSMSRQGDDCPHEAALMHQAMQEADETPEVLLQNAHSYHDHLMAEGGAPTVTPASSSEATHHALHLDHCGYCFFDAHTPAVMHLDTPLASDTAGVALQPLLFFHAPHVLHAWATAQPRGPPTSL